MVSDGDLVAGELRIGGRERSFTIRLPQAAPDERQVPLALVLHGNHPDSGGWIMREWTTFDKQADAWGWAVAYPDGHGGCWADGRGVTTADEAGVDDVAFLRAIIDWSAERCGTRPDQLVVAGISNGAFMAHRLALEASAHVAVLAAIAGGLPAALRDLQPTHAVSAMLIHGTADGISPIDGGYSRHRGPNGELRGRTLSLRETAERWRAIDRCRPGPGETHTTEFSSRTSAGGGVGGTRVVTWTVFGGGHTWPGAPATPDWGEPTTQEFDAAEEICRFADSLLSSADTRRL
jgi:polyhydroxybutyrate depolymerase